MKNTRIAQILNRLMAEKKIRVAELARRVGLPQPTVHRISTGMCEHPHLSSIEPLANFFSISIDQLKGHEPISWLDKIKKVPLLSWQEAIYWSENKKCLSNNELVITDATISHLAYAIKVKDSAMEPVFTKNTLLVADPERQPKDRSYVIAKLADHSEPIFRQLLIDGHDLYLKPLSPDLEQYKMTKLKKSDRILSIVVQAKRDYLEE